MTPQDEPLEINEKTGALLAELAQRTGKTETQVLQMGLTWLKELLDLRDAGTEVYLRAVDESLTRLEVVL